MAKGRFKCPKCDRVFSMVAHLARHESTIHRAKRGRPVAKKKRRRGKAARRLGRPPGTRAVARGATGAGAVRVLREMRSYHGELAAQQAALETQIQTIEAALDAMGAVPAPGRAGLRGIRPVRAKRGRKAAPRRGRPRRVGRPRATASGVRAGSLKDRIFRVLRQRSRPMSPRDIADAVRASGYTTSAKDLPKAVSNTLPEVTSVKKVGRGLYRI